MYHEKLAKQITDYAAKHDFGIDECYESLGGKLYYTNNGYMSTWPEAVSKLHFQKNMFCVELIKTYPRKLKENETDWVAFSTHFSMAITRNCEITRYDIPSLLQDHKNHVKFLAVK